VVVRYTRGLLDVPGLIRNLFGQLLLFVLLTLCMVTGCDGTTLSADLASKSTTPEQLIPKILSVRPHDTGAFTEGLVWYSGFLYESSGLYSESDLRQVDPQTGKVLRRAKDPPQVFGEGLALNGNHLVQLTWQEKIAYVYDLDTLAQISSFSYDGEGWGLCFDGKQYYMTNGSASISARDAKTFALVSEVQVVQDGQPVDMLNELECVGDSLYANVWKTNNILRIDKVTGRITAVIDASGLLTPEEVAAAGPDGDGVLNGIAYDPTHDVFLITGKLWPKMFEVKFVPKGSR
jgi:glutaminyl-peptide cyclotransferase